MKNLDDATALQNRAADPNFSTWLSANAGSGKTRVLTDRVARLLLQGTNPQAILCLTYTKAAANEMQNRLFERLGEWAMLPDQDLRKALQRMGATADIALDHARTLFARAIETPGGLRIQTIHSFCATLLRRFPVEAGVSPRFIEMDEIAQAHLISDIIEEMAGGDSASLVEGLARHYTGEDFTQLARDVVSHRGGFPRNADLGSANKLFGLPADFQEADAIRIAFTGAEPSLFQSVCAELERHGGKNSLTLSGFLRAVNAEAPTFAQLTSLFGPLLLNDGFGPKTKSIPSSRVAKALGALADDFHAFMHRVADARDACLAITAARKTLSLFQFADVFLPEYERRKHLKGWLDFDDLISKAGTLLSDPTASNWVLYRLDGAVDHVLIDEAQDTSPAQWRVIDLLTRDMGAGQGTREDDSRALFVVGDIKQSIYSFQGADPDEFAKMFDHFKRRLVPLGGLRNMELRHSFRSASAILDVTDGTFQGATAEGLGHTAKHISFYSAMPGRVDLWPVVPPAASPDDPPWHDPVDKTAPNHASIVLAEKIAAEIHRLINSETETIPCDDGKKRRRIAAGDFLILVRSRGGGSGVFSKIIRACKARKLPIAGADRLKIRDELGVRDLMSLLSFLALPENDLALAEALRSPIFGWTEQQLFDLAAKRDTGHLWPALRTRRGDFQKTCAILEDLRDQADFKRPYDLIERILVRHGARANLLARLGPESEDAIDELLNQALSYERQDVPSLTGFLAWLESDETEIKRQMESAGERIRVMTVHGAKGLEAPIVILPDTLGGAPQQRGELYQTTGGVPIWKIVSKPAPTVLLNAKEAKARKDAFERQRLLYVAMTRAQNWLIVCGAGSPPKASSWYSAVEEGLHQVDARPQVFPTGEGLRHTNGNWNDPPFSYPETDETVSVPLPGYARRNAEPPVPVIKPLAPSDLGGAKALAGDIGLINQEDALRKGRQIHLLLEHLPAYPKETWPEVSESLMSFGEDAASAEDCARRCAEAARVLDNPEFSDFFTDHALAEVEVTASLPELGGRTIYGAIDRLLIRDGRVLAVDFKSNQVVPPTEAEVPEGILRQLGAYSSALGQVYPRHRIDVAILWTTIPCLMPLSHDIVISALRRAATS